MPNPGTPSACDESCKFSPNTSTTVLPQSKVNHSSSILTFSLMTSLTSNLFFLLDHLSSKKVIIVGNPLKLSQRGKYCLYFPLPIKHVATSKPLFSLPKKPVRSYTLVSQTMAIIASWPLAPHTHPPLPASSPWLRQQVCVIGACYYVSYFLGRCILGA